MKFSTATLISLSAIASSSAFVPHQSLKSSSALYSTTEEQRDTTKKEDRLNFMKSDQFHRRGFKEVRGQVEDTIQTQYQSPLVDDLKSSNYVIEKDGVKVYLAKVCIRLFSFLLEILFV